MNEIRNDNGGLGVPREPERKKFVHADETKYLYFLALIQMSGEHKDSFARFYLQIITYASIYIAAVY